MLGADERERIVGQWNATADASFPLDQPVQRLIEAQVSRTPDAPALQLGEEVLSYAQLNARANQLARHLVHLGVGPDCLVGIALERSVEMVVGLLAVLKAGGAYVPLDPEYPTDRLAYMIEDSGVQLLLTSAGLLERLPVPAGVNCLSLDTLALGHLAEDDLGVAVQGENLAYVIYTSGSTGRPKGAANRHRALTNRLCWMQQAYGLDASDAVLQKTPFSFDVSVWEFFWPLMTGARLVLARPGEHRDPARLVRLINDHGITTLHFVPSMLQAFMLDPRPAAARGSSASSAAARRWRWTPSSRCSPSLARPACTTCTARPRPPSTLPTGPAASSTSTACRSVSRSPTCHPHPRRRPQPGGGRRGR
jgi:non-ribosomal peptide synthetase component F